MTTEYRKDGAAVITRNSAGTYIQNGVLKTAGINEPRFESRGLLSEGASTNLNIFSYDLSQFTIGANYSVSQSADNEYILDNTITSSVATGSAVVSPAMSVVAGNKYIISCVVEFVDIFNADGIVVTARWFNSSGWQAGTVNADFSIDTSTGASWKLIKQENRSGNRQYFEIEIDCDNSVANAAVELKPAFNDSQSVGSVNVTGVQVEKGAPSSYIPANGTAVTRAKDITTIPASNVPAGDWTIACRFDTGGFIAFSMMFGSGSGGSALFLAARDNSAVRVRVGSALFDLPLGYTKGEQTPVVLTKTASTIELTTAAGSASAAYIGDEVLGTDLMIGSDGDGNSQLNGHVKDFRINDYKWTAQEVSDYVNS